MRVIILLSLTCILLAKTPILFINGVVDHCETTKSQTIMQFLKEELDTFVTCIQLSNWRMYNLITNLEEQAHLYCEVINTIPELNGNFHIIGASQGGVIGRYLIERCNLKGKVKTFIAWNSPQMGISAIPWLESNYLWPLNRTGELLMKYLPFSDSISATAYYKGRYNQEEIKENFFFRDLNNELSIKNESYRDRFSSLQFLIAVKSENDHTIAPLASTHFEFWNANGTQIVALKESDFYKKDYIGVRKLDEEGRFHRFVWEDNHHIEFNADYFKRDLIGFLH